MVVVTACNANSCNALEPLGALGNLGNVVDGWKKVEFQIGDRQTDIRTCRAVSLLGHKRKIDLEATAM